MSYVLALDIAFLPNFNVSIIFCGLYLGAPMPLIISFYQNLLINGPEEPIKRPQKILETFKFVEKTRSSAGVKSDSEKKSNVHAFLFGCIKSHVSDSFFRLRHYSNPRPCFSTYFLTF